jgi:hypothetical protein
MGSKILPIWKISLPKSDFTLIASKSSFAFPRDRPQLIEINAAGNTLRLPLDLLLAGVLLAINQCCDLLFRGVEEFL